MIYKYKFGHYKGLVITSNVAQIFIEGIWGDAVPADSVVRDAGDCRTEIFDVPIFRSVQSESQILLLCRGVKCIYMQNELPLEGLCISRVIGSLLDLGHLSDIPSCMFMRKAKTMPQVIT